MKASKYKNKKHYKKQKTRKHNKKNNKKNHKKHNNKSRRKLKRNSKKRRYSRRKKIKGGEIFPIFYNQNQTLGNIYPLSKIGAPVGGGEIYQRAEPVYQSGQLKGGGGANHIPFTGEITTLLNNGMHTVNSLGRQAMGDTLTASPNPTDGHFNHNTGQGARIGGDKAIYFDQSLISSNASTRSY